jgi:hypothetical protein
MLVMEVVLEMEMGVKSEEYHDTVQSTAASGNSNSTSEKYPFLSSSPPSHHGEES